MTARFFAILLLVVGSFQPYSKRLYASVYVCRTALALLAGKILLDFMVTEREDEADDRIQHQKCLHCGYDMRATLYRCPECGEDVLQQLDEYVPDKLIDSEHVAANMDQVKLATTNSSPIITPQHRG